MISLGSDSESDIIPEREALKENETTGSASDAVEDVGLDFSFVEPTYPAGE